MVGEATQSISLLPQVDMMCGENSMVIGKAEIFQLKEKSPLVWYLVFLMIQSMVTTNSMGEMHPCCTPNFFFLSSGGRVITVTGIGFRLAQAPLLIVYSGTQNFTEVMLKLLITVSCTNTSYSLCKNVTCVLSCFSKLLGFPIVNWQCTQFMIKSRPELFQYDQMA